MICQGGSDSSLDHCTLLVDGVSMEFISSPRNIEASKHVFHVSSEPYEISWEITDIMSSDPSTKKETSLLTSSHVLR